MKRPRERVRLNNLEILIAEAGSAAKVAQLAGTSESYLSQVRRQMRSQNGTPRGLGNELAAKLEKGLGKPDGWMDEPHEPVLIEEDNQQNVWVGNPVFYTGGETVAVELPSDHPMLQEDLGAWYGDRKKPTVVKHKIAKGADVVTLCPMISWGQACDVIRAKKPFHESQVEEILPSPVPCSQGTFILRVKGASMEPKFHHGDLIFVDPKIPPESGKYVVVQLEDSDEAMFKQLIIEGGRQYLKALNPDWPERIVEVSNGTEICGVVVFKGERI
jgi:SOS-response transcriptional repressor LexA